MVGLHTFIGKHSKKELEQLDFLKHESWFIIEQLETTAHTSMFMSSYNGYPYIVFKDDSWTIIVEGMIYNFSDEEVKNKCEKIAIKFISKGNYINEIKEFVSFCDGDFIIQIFDKKSDRYLVFNDYLGRLPLYYSIGNDIFTISRDIKTNLEFSSKINIDLTSVTEFLMLSYSLGDKTFFKNIHRLKPCKAIILEDLNNIKNFEIVNTGTITYNRTKSSLNKEEVLTKLTDQFLVDAKNRISKFSENKYEVISDLSGGFDSRALIGALSKYDKNIKYFTFEYIQDESLEAQHIFNELSKPGEYIKLNFENVLDVDKISDLVYKTNGLVDFLTTSICYNDASSLKEYLDQNSKIAHFGGFGGEFIRHPEKKYFKSIFYGFKNGFYSREKLNDVLSILNSSSFIIEEIKDYFDREYRGNAEEQLRKFYNEYYLFHVGHAGEERSRLFNWTVHPLWSKDLVKIIFKEVPLRWTGYKFFIEFMKLIDKKLLNIPIYKRDDLNMNSKSSIRKYEKSYRRSFGANYKFRSIVNYYLPILASAYRRLKNKRTINSTDNNNFYNEFLKYYYKLEKTKSIFNLKKIKPNISSFGGEYNRLTTLAMYFSEVEKRYKDKIEEIKI